MEAVRTVEAAKSVAGVGEWEPSGPLAEIGRPLSVRAGAAIRGKEGWEDPMAAAEATDGGFVYSVNI